jgi:hypothetical protein
MMVLAVGTPQVDDILPTAEPARMPSATRQWVLAVTEACAPLEDGIVNAHAIDPADGAGLQTITRVTAVAIANGDRNHPRLGASAMGSNGD